MLVDHAEMFQLIEIMVQRTARRKQRQLFLPLPFKERPIGIETIVAQRFDQLLERGTQHIEELLVGRILPGGVESLDCVQSPRAQDNAFGVFQGVG